MGNYPEIKLDTGVLGGALIFRQTCHVIELLIFRAKKKGIRLEALGQNCIMEVCSLEACLSHGWHITSRATVPCCCLYLDSPGFRFHNWPPVATTQQIGQRIWMQLRGFLQMNLWSLSSMTFTAIGPPTVRENVILGKLQLLCLMYQRVHVFRCVYI